MTYVLLFFPTEKKKRQQTDTQTLIEIEREKLELYRQHLELQKERLALEREKFEWERRKFTKEIENEIEM